MATVDSAVEEAVRADDAAGRRRPDDARAGARARRPGPRTTLRRARGRRRRAGRASRCGTEQVPRDPSASRAALGVARARRRTITDIGIVPGNTGRSAAPSEPEHEGDSVPRGGRDGVGEHESSSGSTTCGSDADSPARKNRLMLNATRIAAKSAGPSMPGAISTADGEHRDQAAPGCATSRVCRRLHRSRNTPTNGPSTLNGSSTAASAPAIARGVGLPLGGEQHVRRQRDLEHAVGGLAGDPHGEQLPEAAPAKQMPQIADEPHDASVCPTRPNCKIRLSAGHDQLRVGSSCEAVGGLGWVRRCQAGLDVSARRLRG